jgi:hypothetical protein
VPDDVPDLYVDSFRVTVGTYGVNLTFALGPPHTDPGEQAIATPRVVLRMSLEHAKAVAMLLRKQLRTYERDNGEINLPPQVYTGLGYAREDWGIE